MLESRYKHTGEESLTSRTGGKWTPTAHLTASEEHVEQVLRTELAIKGPTAAESGWETFSCGCHSVETRLWIASALVICSSLLRVYNDCQQRSLVGW